MTKIDKEKIVQRNVLCVPQTCRGICHRRGSRDAKGLSDLRKQGGFQAKIGSKNPLQNRCESHVVCDVCAYPHEQKTIFHATKIFRTNPIETYFVCGFRDDFAFCQNFSTLWKTVSQPTGMVQSL